MFTSKSAVVVVVEITAAGLCNEEPEDEGKSYPKKDFVKKLLLFVLGGTNRHLQKIML